MFIARTVFASFATWAGLVPCPCHGNLFQSVWYGRLRSDSVLNQIYNVLKQKLFTSTFRIYCVIRSLPIPNMRHKSDFEQ